MNSKVQKIIYTLSGIVLFLGFFMFMPSQSPSVSLAKNEMKQEVSVAWQETMGDQSWFTDVSYVYDGVSSFYSQSSDSLIALLTPDSNSDQDTYMVLSKTYHLLTGFFGKNSTLAVNTASADQVAGKNFMSEPAVDNIVPNANTAPSGAVSGITTSVPVNAKNSWVTIRDNLTGQLYCLAIYNNEVNKYLGACPESNKQN